MIIEIDMPKVDEGDTRIVHHWLQSIFVDGGPKNYATKAVLGTYMRAVEAAKDQYEQAGKYLEIFWQPSGDVRVGAINRSSSYFEACITNMLRAIRCMIVLRNSKDVPQGLKDKLGKPSFIKDKNNKRIRNVRDAVAHTEKLVLDGTIPENTPFGILVVGDERPHPEQVGQTIRKLNRIEIGEFSVLFSDLQEMLTEMILCCRLVSDYENWK